MNILRYLIVIHRWFGIGMCLLFASWFASGIIMMYVEYPELTEDERLETLPVLAIDQILFSAEQAILSNDIEDNISGLTLTSVLDRPAYQILDKENNLTTIFADDGEIFTGLNSAQAIDAVIHSGFWSPGSLPRYDGIIDIDQWTVSSGLNKSRPLHKIEVGDPRGTVVYVSDVSGQIVRDTNRNERFWNWLGSTIHWIYPMQLRRNVDLWIQVIIYLSLAGMISVVTGGIIGFMRIRVRKRYAGDRMSPYRGIDKWHHIIGLFSLIFISTFIFSGLMSIAPWGIFDSKVPVQDQIDRYTGGNFDSLQDLQQPDFQYIHQDIKEIEWLRISGEIHFIASKSWNNRFIIPAKEPSHDSSNLLDKIKNAVPDLIPDTNLLSLETLNEYDNYYYSRHNSYRPMPILRAKFNDKESTWFHIDQNTGEIINRLTYRGRVARWLFNGLHSLDFHFLISKRPLWDIVVILLSITGFIFSITSIIIGWRRLTQ